MLRYPCTEKGLFGCNFLGTSTAVFGLRVPWQHHATHHSYTKQSRSHLSCLSSTRWEAIPLCLRLMHSQFVYVVAFHIQPFSGLRKPSKSTQLPRLKWGMTTKVVTYQLSRFVCLLWRGGRGAFNPSGNLALTRHDIRDFDNQPQGRDCYQSLLQVRKCNGAKASRGRLFSHKTKTRSCCPIVPYI